MPPCSAVATVQSHFAGCHIEKEVVQSSVRIFRLNDLAPSVKRKSVKEVTSAFSSRRGVDPEVGDRSSGKTLTFSTFYMHFSISCTTLSGKMRCMR